MDLDEHPPPNKCQFGVNSNLTPIIWLSMSSRSSARMAMR